MPLLLIPEDLIFPPDDDGFYEALVEALTCPLEDLDRGWPCLRPSGT